VKVLAWAGFTALRASRCSPTCPARRWGTNSTTCDNASPRGNAGITCGATRGRRSGPAWNFDPNDNHERGFATKPLLTLGCAVCGWGGLAVPVPKQKPALKAETILSGQRFTADVPDRAGVTITNVSDADVDIGSKWEPEAHLGLRVNDHAGADVKTERRVTSVAAQSLTPKPYILKPGKTYRCEVDLLGTVPEGKRLAGTYRVKVVYTVGKKEYASDEVEVKWPGNGK